MKTATNAMQQASVARTNLGRIWKFRHIYVFLLPAIVWYAIFCYYPMYGVLLAFKDYKFNLGILGSPWVGLKYFETFLTDSCFYIILKNTLAISLLKLICGFPAPILFALMINEVTHVKYKKVVQTLSYLPHFVSWVVVISLMQKLFSPYNGIVNDIRQMINPEAEAIFYLGEPAYFYPMVVGSDIWKGVGWGSIVYLAALRGIRPRSRRFSLASRRPRAFHQRAARSKAAFASAALAQPARNSRYCTASFQRRRGKSSARSPARMAIAFSRCSE